MEVALATGRVGCEVADMGSGNGVQRGRDGNRKKAMLGAEGVDLPEQGCGLLAERCEWQQGANEKNGTDNHQHGSVCDPVRMEGIVSPGKGGKATMRCLTCADIFARYPGLRRYPYRCTNINRPVSNRARQTCLRTGKIPSGYRQTSSNPLKGPGRTGWWQPTQSTIYLGGANSGPLNTA